jgi:excisionase family DNA binding protein
MLESRMTSQFLTTREAAALLGVGTTSIKRWADTGVLRCVKTAGGHRRFERHAVEALIGSGPELASSARDDLDRWIRVLLGREPGAVGAEIDRELAAHGSWWALAETLGEVLEEIGRRWNLGEMSILDEHLASERLARALAAAAAAIEVPDDAPTALLVASEGDDHTLGLSLVEVCLASSGWRCAWAGRNTPFAEVRRAVESGRIQLIGLSASAASTNEAHLAEQAARYGALSQKWGIDLLIGGGGRWPEHLAYGNRITTFQALRDALSRIRPIDRDP